MFLKCKSGCITRSKGPPCAAHLGLCTCPSLCLGGPLSPERQRAHHIAPLGRFPDYLAFHPELSRPPGDRSASCLPLGPASVSPAPCTGHTRAAAQETRPDLGARCQAAPRPHPPPATPALQLPGWPDFPGPCGGGWLASCCLATRPHSGSPPRPQVVKRVLAQTSSGGFCGNDGFMHMTLASLPFGGVGRCPQSPAFSCCSWTEGTPTPPSCRNLPDLSLHVHMEVDPRGHHLGFLAPLSSRSLGHHRFSHQRHGFESAHQLTRGGLTCSLYSTGRLRTAP